MKSKLTLRDFSLLLSLLAIGGFFAIAAPQFLSARNLSMLTVELAITATLALGMLLVILPGHIDLSVGSGVGLMGGIATVLIIHHGWPAWAAMTGSGLVALVLWMAMGALIIRQRIPAFIITLGGLLIFKGAFWLVIGSHTIPVVAGGSSNLYSLPRSARRSRPAAPRPAPCWPPSCSPGWSSSISAPGGGARRWGSPWTTLRWRS